MLQIHFSNRYEVLAERLIAQLGAAGDVFTAEQVIVPSVALERALTLALTERHGICAQVEFSFLAQWLWRQIGRVLPGIGRDSPYAPPVLAWRIHAAFGEAGWLAAHPRLAAYLAEADPVMRHELACRVASLFDQTLTYRPDWLAAWLEGRLVDVGSDAPAAAADQAWQAALWRRLEADLAASPQHAAQHPANAFLEALAAAGPTFAAGAGLPASAHVFCLPTMPPLYLALLRGLSRWVDVQLYVLNPCREYWFELVDSRRLSHLAARGAALHHETVHRQLAAWGQQTQAHIDLLVEAGGEEALDDALFVPHPGSRLLARWQNAVLDLDELAPGSVTLAADDRSIEGHVCHTATRELEVLHDTLLGLFAGPDAPAPGEILVVTPDLEAMAPLVDAVFGTAPRERYIPYTVTGRPRSGVNPAARTLLALLALMGSRLGASEVMGLLQWPIVARRFGFGDDDLALVHRWLQAAGVHWALDADHRASFDVPASARHTWADGLERLFLGYALPAQAAAPFDGRLPAGDVEGGEALVLGALAQCIDTLAALQRHLALPLPPQAWLQCLAQAVEAFLQPADDELEDWRELQAALQSLGAQWERARFDEPLPLAVVRAALEALLDDPARGGVPSGVVTFAAMSSLRGLPYRVVCALGLNDGAFPTPPRPAEFDLMVLRPRRGDRQRRLDERNLFLDLLLAARERVILSWVGHSVRDNAPLPPSVLVAELFEHLQQAIADDPADAGSLVAARHRLVIEHPLQAYATEAFRPGADPRLRSYQREYAEALQAAAPAAHPAAPPLSHDDRADDAEADAEGDETIDDLDDDTTDDPGVPFFLRPLPVPGPEWRTPMLEGLIRFFRNPCRVLLQQRLAIALEEETEPLDDDEPFVADGLARSRLATRLLPALLGGADAASAEALALAGTEFPEGRFGREALTAELAELQRYAEAVRAATAAPSLPPHQAVFPLEIDGEAWTLQAAWADLQPEGLVRTRYGKTGAADALPAWLHHLALCAEPPPGGAKPTVWLARDAHFRLRVVPREEARAHLATLLRLYRSGLREPLHFYPRAAWAYVESEGKLARARQAWQVTPQFAFGEARDAAYRLALRGVADPLDDEFMDNATTVFGPLFDVLERLG